MSRNPTGRPNGRPKSRNTADARQRRCHTAMIYWMLINEGHSPSAAKDSLNESHDAVKKAMAEFKDDEEVRLIRERKFTRAQWREHVDKLIAKLEVARLLRDRAFLIALEQRMPKVRGRPSIMASAGNPALLRTKN